MSKFNHLSGIDTQWSMIHKAHERGNKDKIALTTLIERYGPAAKRYLLASLRSEEAADEVFQEFALRLIRGDFKQADPHKGRFRTMIKTSLYHLMIDFHRREQKRRRLGTSSGIEYIAAGQLTPVEETFTIAWRETLLHNVWTRLQQLQEQTGKPYYSALRTRVDFPELTTKQLFLQLGDVVADLSPETGFRVFLHRARRRFAALMLDQVKHSLQNPSPADVEAELIELGLYHFCKPVIASV